MHRLIRSILAFVATWAVIGGLTVTPPSQAAAPAAGAMPAYDHVFMLTEENHGFSQIIGNPAAPTINNLAHAYGYASNYYGVAHPSGPSYVAKLRGGTFGVASDNPYWLFHVNAPSLMSQLDAAHKSWKGYFQGMPYAGYTGYCYPARCMGVPDSDTLYIAKHNGMAYFSSVNSNPTGTGQDAAPRPAAEGPQQRDRPQLQLRHAGRVPRHARRSASLCRLGQPG